MGFRLHLGPYPGGLMGAARDAREMNREMPTVLVIDDDLHLRALFSTALERVGFGTVAAPDGASGLEILRSRSVDLVVCDVSMPGMTGLDFVRSVRAMTETATLPIILVTGSSAPETVVAGLAAGADDFLTKPVRLDELVARVRAHIRTQSAWLDTIQSALRSRFSVVSTLAGLRPSSDPETTAQMVIDEITGRADVSFAAVFQVAAGNRGRILATTLAPDGEFEAVAPSARRMRYLVDRALAGAWTESLDERDPLEPNSAFWEAGFAVLAGAPILWDERLVGILTMGRRREANQPISSRARDLLLATAIDCAAVLGTTIGPSLVARGERRAEEERLRRILVRSEYEIAFQPIVDLRSRAVLGVEALARFTDGVPPNVRFAEAQAAGLGPDFELASIAMAVRLAAGLPSGAFLGLNVSPEVVIAGASRLRELLRGPRRVVLEITEHVQIADYAALRGAIAAIGVDCAVDDAGAGFASMRHMLELQPSFVKLDISLVRGINEDRLREALAAGLVHYAERSGIQLIAEGVEAEAEASTLARLGVGMGQGYLFGAPVAVNRLAEAGPAAST